MESKLYPVYGNSEYGGLYIIPGTPVLYVKGYDTIVFSDLHIGFEEAVARGLDYSTSKTTYVVGMFIPRIQLKRIIETLNTVFEVVKPKRVVINGDLKHAFDRLLRQERDEVKHLLNYLLDKGIEEIVLIRGNHDNFLPLVLKDYGIELLQKYELVLGDLHIVFTHGHLEVYPREASIVVIGHEHPSLRCMGMHKFPVFLKIPTTLGPDILVLPAIGPYHPGTQIALDPHSYLSPIIRKHGVLDRARVIMWINLGELLEAPKEFCLEESVGENSIVLISKFTVGNREVAIVDFAGIDKALAICGSL